MIVETIAETIAIRRNSISAAYRKNLESMRHWSREKGIHAPVTTTAIEGTERCCDRQYSAKWSNNTTSKKSFRANPKAGKHGNRDTLRLEKNQGPEIKQE